MTANILTWDELVNSGELEGYDEPYINLIDADTAAEFACENCGGQCIGTGRRGAYGYRCFSVCTKCSRALEF